MSGFGRWSLGIGLGLLVVAVISSVVDLIPVAVIAGVVGLVGVGWAVWDTIESWAERSNLRRRAAKVQREREQGR